VRLLQEPRKPTPDAFRPNGLRRRDERRNEPDRCGNDQEARSRTGQDPHDGEPAEVVMRLDRDTHHQGNESQGAGECRGPNGTADQLERALDGLLEAFVVPVRPQHALEHVVRVR